MSRAVRFDEYGGVDVLKVVEVQDPVPGPGQLLVRVKAAGINPGEAQDPRGRCCTSAGRRRSRRARAATSPAWSRRSATASTASRPATR